MPLIQKLKADHQSMLGSLVSPLQEGGLVVVAAEICQRLKNKDFFSARMMVSSLIHDNIKKSACCPKHIEEIVYLSFRVASAAVHAPIEVSKTVNVQPVVEAYWIARDLMSTRNEVAENAGRSIAAQVARETRSVPHLSAKALHKDAVHLINRNNRQASILLCG